jgi:hypothetical protein
MIKRVLGKCEFPQNYKTPGYSKLRNLRNLRKIIIYLVTV